MVAGPHADGPTYKNNRYSRYSRDQSSNNFSQTGTSASRPSTKVAAPANAHLLPEVFIGGEDYNLMGASFQSTGAPPNAPKKKPVGKLAPLGHPAVLEEDPGFDGRPPKLSNASALRKHGQLAPINFG